MYFLISLPDLTARVLWSLWQPVSAEVRFSKFLLRLLLVIGLEAAGDAFFNERISL